MKNVIIIGGVSIFLNWLTDWYFDDWCIYFFDVFFLGYQDNQSEFGFYETTYSDDSYNTPSVSMGPRKGSSFQNYSNAFISGSLDDEPPLLEGLISNSLHLLFNSFNFFFLKKIRTRNQFWTHL